MEVHRHAVSVQPRIEEFGVRGARRLRPLLTVAATLILTLAPATQAAAAQPTVQCGAVLTADTTLNADLTCTGDALVIGADGITVDLRGHTIHGSGTGTGISILQHGSVQIHHGTIAGFARAAFVDGAHDVTFTKMTMRDGIGLDQRGSQNVRFVDGALRSARVLVSSSTDFTISRSKLDNSPLSFVDSFSTVVSDSVLTDSFVNFSEVSNGAVTDSTLIRSPVFVILCGGIVVRHNRIQDADNGVLIGSTALRTQVLDNTFTGNRIGVLLDATFVDLVDGTSLSGNVFRHNAAAGVLFEATGVLGGATVTIDRNRLLNNGFAAAGRVDHLGNPVADGLHIAVPAGATIRVADNATRHNASYGIFAVPGTVVDGGGNSSAADPNGCLGVVCA